MEKFNTYLKHIDLDFWRELCMKHGRLRHYEPGEYFCTQGQPCRVFGFIEKGMFKFSLIDSAGNESITSFDFEGTPISDYLAVITDVPAHTSLIAKMPSDVYVCDRSVVQKLFKENPELHAVFADSLGSQIYNRYLDMFRYSPKERYQKLMAACPEILEVATLKEIASYLHITPIHLSRIRKDIAASEK